MIFVILNAILAVLIILVSMNVNTKNQGAENGIINVMILDATAAIVMFLAVLGNMNGPERIVIILEHLELFLNAAIFTEISLLYLTIANQKKTAFHGVLRVIFLVFAAFLTFTKLHIVEPSTFTMTAPLIFKGPIKMTFPITWLQVFVFVYVFAFPLYSILIMLLKSENSNSRLGVQKAIMSFFCIAFGWVGMVLIYYISDMLPMMRSLFMYIVAVMSVLILNTVTQDKIYDGAMMFSTVLSVVIKYFVPAILGAILYVALRPLYTVNYWLYVAIIYAGILLIMLVGRFVSSGFAKLLKYRSSQYESEFEQALAAINYESEVSNIAQEFLKAFQDNLQTTTMTAMMDTGFGEFTTTYSSENKNYKLMKNAKVFETLMNNEIFIVFREDLVSSYLLQPVRSELEEMFDEVESEVLIVLHEGHQVLGLLFLGEKHTGSSYDEYDKQVFDKFYSYFFVFGYYMKNIANAAVVGTVNREIRMSSQIITSIQENMDYIRNSKVDVGYLMVPAHNIGGEFVDMIRLNDTSHIMVIGSLSGKGISASMSMVILKSIIRTFLADTHDFKKLIQKVNAFIRFNLPKGTFFSGVFCLVDFEKDTMYYINCGIPTLLMYSKAYNNVIEIQGKGYVLGFVKDISPLLKVKQIKLSAGDMLAVSTNGLITSHSLRGEQFGKERFKQTLLDNYTYPATRIARFCFDNLQRFMSKELEDDITLLVVRYFGKDGIEIEDDAESAQERLIDHIGSFDADALIDGAIEDTSIEVTESEPAVTEEDFDKAALEEEAVQKANMDEPVAEPLASETVPSEETSIGEDEFKIPDSLTDDMFNDEMFSADFSNPNAGISIDDIVDPEVFDEKTEV